MSTIVEATVPAEGFALSETFAREPNVEFRLVRLVAHGLGHVMPFMWADCDDIDRLQRVVESDESVDSVDVLVEVHGEYLLQIDWGSSVRFLASILDQEDASILDASGYDDAWHLQIFFPDHDLVSPTLEFCEEYGIDIFIERIDRLSETTAYGYLSLTERQYETLVNAHDHGYYDVPRAVNQAELATDFGVSHQALSERLRRAHRTVITNALYHEIHRRNHAVSSRTRHEVDT